MKTSIKRFSLSLAAALSFLAVATTGVASACSISNTGPGSVNVVSGCSGSIDTTGPGSVNVVGGNNSCHHWWSWCTHRFRSW